MLPSPSTSVPLTQQPGPLSLYFVGRFCNVSIQRLQAVWTPAAGFRAAPWPFSINTGRYRTESCRLLTSEPGAHAGLYTVAQLRVQSTGGSWEFHLYTPHCLPCLLQAYLSATKPPGQCWLWRRCLALAVVKVSSSGWPSIRYGCSQLLHPLSGCSMAFPSWVANIPATATVTASTNPRTVHQGT